MLVKTAPRESAKLGNNILGKGLSEKLLEAYNEVLEFLNGERSEVFFEDQSKLTVVFGSEIFVVLTIEIADNLSDPFGASKNFGAKRNPFIIIGDIAADARATTDDKM